MAEEPKRHAHDPISTAQVDVVAEEGADGVSSPGTPAAAAGKAAWSWTSIAVVALGIAAVIVLAVTLPVCLTQGCPKKPTTATTARKALRLIVALNNQQDALQSLPPELQQFAQNIKLNSSQLQVLTLQSEEILQQVERILKENPDLELLLRDFSLATKRLPATLVKPGEQPLPWAAAPQDNPRRQQQQDGQAGGPLLQQQQVEALVQQHNAGWLQRYQRRLQQDAGGGQPFLTQISAPGAWNITTGQPSIVVAVLDTGVDVNHHALRGALWVNPREVPGNGVDDDGNGYVDDVNGFSFQGSCDGDERDYFGGCISCTDNGDVTDTVGHGTHVAGIIAAARDEAAGVVGVAPSVRIMVLKVANCMDGVIYGSSVFRAMDYAVRMGADVLSCSFSRQYAQGFAAVSPAPPWENHASETSGFTKAITPLAAANVVVVSAAGNNRVDLDKLSTLGYANNPCLVPLPNVMCVGATDDQDRLADYSNSGLQVVDMSAPGTIRSTWIGDSYADSWGTSMATPVVSATAALVISVIQRLTGNFTAHGAATKGFLISSADTPAAAAGAYSRRVNAARAVDAAVKAFTNAAGVPATAPLRAAWALPGAVPSGIEVAGVTEGYYWTPGTPGTSWQQRAPQDSSTRGASLPFGGFKYSTNMTVVITGNLRMDTAGLYLFRLSPASAQLFINGAAARPLTSPLLGTATRTLPLLAGAPGVYQLQVVVANPGPPVDLMVLGPSADTYQRVTGLFTYLPPPPADATPGGPNAPTSNTTLLMLWNTTAAGVTLPRAAQVTAASAGSLQQGAAINGVSLTAPGALSGLLLPPGVSSGSAVGLVGAALTVPSSPLGGWAFRLTCAHCTLSLGGNVVLDNWEGAATNSVRTKNSGCMAFSMPVTAQLPVLLSFVVPNILSSSQLALSWAPCSTGGGSATFGAWSNVPLTTTAAWQPGTTLTGSIGGMQCSLWRATSVPRPGVPPLYKWRLPGAMSAVNSLTAGVNLAFNTTLEVLLPGLSATYPASNAANRFSLRCWTYTGGARQQALVLRAGGTPGATTSAFEGEVQVWNGIASQRPLQRANWGTSRQQLLLLWQNITASSQLTVLRGGQVLVVSGSTMTLPIAVVPAFKGALMAGPGHFSQAFTPGAAGDAGNLVTYSSAGMSPQGTFNNPTFGLNVAVGSYAGVAAGSLRYARTVGYFKTPVSSLSQVNLTIGEPAGQGCLVMVGGVVLRNGVGFNSRMQAPATSEYVLMLPPGFVQIQVVLKSRAAGSGATFSVGAAAPGSPRANVAPPAWWQAQPTVLQD